jgi:two-component system response regulator (stage 0 sporulation protein A)
MREMKILIADGDSLFRKALENAMEQNSHITLVCSTGREEEAIDCLHTQQIDAVILDLILEQGDGLSVLREIQSCFPNMITVLASSLLRGQLINRSALYGVGQFVPKPCTAQHILELFRENPQGEVCFAPGENPLEVIVTDLLRQMGFPPHVKGYQYIRRGVVIVAENEEHLGGITKSLYPMLARRYRTSTDNVERSIRYAIETAWKQGSAEAWEYYYGTSLRSGGKRPSNAALIAALSDRVRFAYTATVKYKVN